MKQIAITVINHLILCAEYKMEIFQFNKRETTANKGLIKGRYRLGYIGINLNIFYESLSVKSKQFHIKPFFISITNITSHQKIYFFGSIRRNR
jgi:hypothetical protein